MDALAKGGVFVFEAFRLDRQARVLFRRDEVGAFVPIAIGSRALDVLGLLVGRAPDLVSRDELIAAVWSAVIVEDTNLNMQIAALRRLLDEGRAGGSCIQTIPRRGYRFAVTVTRVEAETRENAALRPAVDPPLATFLEAVRDQAERRPITALASELIVLSGQTDAGNLENLREALDAFRHCISEAAARHDGFVFSSLGNMVLVLFGYPAAHENDAEQAVRAGLELCASVQTLSANTDCAARCRVGIETGIVIVGNRVGESRDRTIVGDAPMMAARLQALAQPDTVAIGPTTRRLIGDLFDYRDLGAIEVGGLAWPVPAWRVLHASAIETRFEALRGSSLAPLLGRDEEIDLLLRRWSRAKAGDGQIVLVTGEPGIGKSRLCAELEERLHTETHFRRRYSCSRYHQDSALFPFIDQLGRAAGFARDDPPATRLDKLEALVGSTAAEEDVAFLANLLSLPASRLHPLPNLSPQRIRERTLQAMIRQLEASARQQPVLMVFEDAHWIDPTSRELLDLAVERIRSLPVLLIVTFRPEFQPPWTGQPQVTMLALSRLDRHDRTVLVEQIAGGKSLPDEVINEIAERTDGVPLFVEELTKSVLESGLLREEGDRYVLDSALPTLAIPTSLHASLLARLDRLASVHLVAQIGAAIGCEFSYQLLHAVSRLPGDELQAALLRLVTSELVFQRGTPPDAVYSFKHALVQDAAHGSLLRSARQQLHAQIAEAFEAQSPELMDSQPELFAQHYAEAGLVEKSVACWGKAGRKSIAGSAMAEAAAQFQKALDQLVLLPDSPERQRQELELWNALGVVLNVVRGFGAQETGQAYARARALWEHLGSPLEFIRIPYGQARYHLFRGELNVAQRLDDDLLRLSRQRNDSAGLILGHLSSGRNLRFAGRFALSRSHLEQVLALYDPNSHRSLVDQAGTHPQNNSQSLLGVVLFCLGFLDEALARSNAAIAEARMLAYLPSLASSLSNGTTILLLVGDDAALDERADQLVAVTTEQGFPFWRAEGTMVRGWVKVKNGDVAEGISLLRSGLAAYRSIGSKSTYFIALLAMACEIAGQVEEASTLLDDALQIVERTGERWLEAELYRHKGQLLLHQGHSEAAEELYRKALSIAAEQGAKLWKLRAAVSLARLRRDQGRPAQARDLLAPVYSWFTEGFATPDLKDAKALLDQLA